MQNLKPDKPSVLAKLHASAIKQSLERQLEMLLRSKGLIGFQREYQFHPTRRWRFDFADPQAKIAVECEGGVYGFKCPKCGGTGAGGQCKSCRGTGKAFGRHSRATGLENDAEKYNRAAIMGWRVLRFTTRQLKQQPLQCVELIQEALKCAHADTVAKNS